MTNVLEFTMVFLVADLHFLKNLLISVFFIIIVAPCGDELGEAT
jgi:hypothetical protein